MAEQVAAGVEVESLLQHLGRLVADDVAQRRAEISH
jgi:hypothetical protein